MGRVMTIGLLAITLGVACTPEVFINELVADNETGSRDEASQYEDWVELYSPSDDVDLTGWGLADSAFETPWPFPEGAVVPGGGYLVIWTDKDPEDGRLHTNFKLSRDGESVLLLSPNDSVVDEVVFPALDPDTAWGRMPDGGETWVELVPSPGQPND